MTAGRVSARIIDMIDDKERKSHQVLRKLFKEWSASTMGRDEAINRIGVKAFQNNTGPLHNHGLVTYERASGKGRRILNLMLTEKGQAVLSAPATTTTTIDPLTNLDALGDFVERFNSRSKYWELKLTPKEQPMKH